MRRARQRRKSRTRWAGRVNSAQRIYQRHRDLIQVLAAAFIGGGVVSNLYVTRESADAMTRDLSGQIAQVSEQLAEQRALTDFRLREHDSRLAALENGRR